MKYLKKLWKIISFPIVYLRTEWYKFLYGEEFYWFVRDMEWRKRREDYLNKTTKSHIDLDIYNFGWGNGYVIIPRSHPLWGKHYDDIDVDVHGGLTFSSAAKDLDSTWPIPDQYKSGWVVGFDTAHYSDTPERWPKTAVMEETNRLLEQLKNYKK